MKPTLRLVHTIPHSYFLTLTLFMLSLSVHAGEMYYNRLSKGNTLVPKGNYGDIVVPAEGYRATEMSSTAQITEAAGDFGGSYSNIAQTVATSACLMPHTVSGWFRIPPGPDGERTLYLATTGESGTHRGYGLCVTNDGQLVVGKVTGIGTWQDDKSHFKSTGVVPLDQWFYLTVGIAVTNAMAHVSVYTNGVAVAMPNAHAFTNNLNGAFCSNFKIGKDVSCAGVRIDDTAVSDMDAIKSWATNARYVVPRFGTQLYLK